MFSRIPLVARSFGGAGRPTAGGDGSLGALHGNEPVGAVVVLDRSYNALDETDAAGVTWADADGFSDTQPFQTVAIIADGTAPQSASNVARVESPTGYSGLGVSQPAVRLTGDLPTIDTLGQQLYLEFWFKISPNYYGHTGGQNKIFYVGQPVIIEFGSPGTGNDQYLHWTIALQGGEILNVRPTTAGNNLTPTDAQHRIERDTWYHLECLMVMNTPGTANGELHFWVNGAKVMEFSNRNLLAPGATQYSFIGALDWHPIYGGGGAESVPATMHQYMDHVYASVVL